MKGINMQSNSLINATWNSKWLCLLVASNLCLMHLCAYAVDTKEVNVANRARAVEPKSFGEIVVTGLQSKQVVVVPVTTRAFSAKTEAIGYIDFNLDKTVQIFAPYAGKIRQVFAKSGDNVKAGQALFSIDSSELVQAESTLIATAGVRALTLKALDRATKMLEIQAISQKDWDQAASDQQVAEAGFNAARNALKIFGKSDHELDAIVASRTVDGEFRITSPFAGRVTSRNAVPGLFVQPGNAPPPFVVADLSTKWMVAAVSEYNIPSLRLGQHVSVFVPAFPDRKFQGEIVNIGAAVDTNTHRISVRSEIADPHFELHPQMLARFIIHSGQQSKSVAIPANAVVREGDGTQTVFVTTDGLRFARRPVTLGMMQDNNYQVVEGLTAGEKIATDGAIFLGNALALQSR